MLSGTTFPPDARGAKSVIDADFDRVVAFEFADGAMDLDTAADLREWRERWHHRARSARLAIGFAQM